MANRLLRQTLINNQLALKHGSTIFNRRLPISTSKVLSIDHKTREAQIKKLFSGMFKMAETSLGHLEQSFGGQIRELEKKMGADGLFDRFKTSISQELQRSQQFVGKERFHIDYSHLFTKYNKSTDNLDMKQMSQSTLNVFPKLEWLGKQIPLEVGPIPEDKVQRTHNQYVWRLHYDLSERNPQDIKAMALGHVVTILASEKMDKDHPLVAKQGFSALHVQAESAAMFSSVFPEDVDMSTVKGYLCKQKKEFAITAQFKNGKDLPKFN